MFCPHLIYDSQCMLCIYIYFNHLDCGISKSQVQRKMFAITTAVSNLEECASQTKKQTNITRSNYAVTGSKTQNLESLKTERTITIFQ